MRKGSEAALLAGIALVLGAGVVRLLDLRYAAGDVYPPYSSLRSDPLGSRVLHDALLLLPGLEVGRRTTPLHDLDRETATVVLVLGAGRREALTRATPAARLLPSLAARGARIVVTLAPVAGDPAADCAPPRDGGEGEPAPETVPGDPAHSGVRPLEAVWGLRTGSHPLPRDAAGEPRAGEARRAAGVTDLPPAIPWHSATHFEALDPAWIVLYERGGRPVLIERPFGRGSVVLASDSYFASNEAMLRERPAALLLRLAGGRPRILFDETHHGVIAARGIASLLGRYRLHGALLAAAAVFGLFLWRRLTPFVPPYDEDEAGGGAVTGRDAAAGLLSLVQRGVPPRDLLRVCIEEYSRPPAGGAPLPSDIAVHASIRDPVAGYRAIARALASRRRRSTIPGGTSVHGQ